MCGIAGLIKPGVEKDQLRSQAKAMSDAIAHRGPDDGGVWLSDKLPIAVSHRRLSILDLSTHGNQPMVSPAKNTVIVFNGEIYNFSKLKSRLRQAGQIFTSHSDTEVLLHYLDNFGVDACLQDAKGMFAFAYLDEDSETLTLARDSIGEKPLYYGVKDGTLFFASELKAIYQIFPAAELTLNPDALNSFLRYGYVSAPQSIFSEVKKLPPGAKAIINIRDWISNKNSGENHIVVEKYWSVGTISRNAELLSSISAETAVQELDVMLNDIIEEQSVADVSLGAFLSGGIDSSLVTAILQAQSHGKVETFTVGFHNKDFNEAEHAKNIAKHLNTAHNELYLDREQILGVVPSLPKIYDEPFADSSQIPTYLVSQFAKSKLTVCLSGDGGDELFIGYNRYTNGQKIALYNQTIPKPLRHWLSKLLQLFPPSAYDNVYQSVYSLLGKKGGANFGAKIYKASDTLLQEDPYRLYQLLCSYHKQPSRLITPDSSDATLASAYPFEKSYLNAALEWDQQWYLPGNNLVKSDRASMAVSLETRVPLLDKDLIEYSWRIPNRLKYNNGKSKWLLREVLYRYVPQRLIDRPKMGFSVPVAQWLREDLRDWAEGLLNSDIARNEELFNYPLIDKLWQQHQSRKFDHANKLWTLLMFFAWHEYWLSPNPDHSSGK